MFYKLISGIQNGDPDGFAIVNTATSEVLDFISYGGVITATGGPANGMTSTDVGVSQTTSEIAGEAALGLTGTGASSSDFTWTKFSGIAHSPGLPNSGQTFVESYLPSQGLAIDNVSVTFLNDTDLDGLPDITDSDDDNDGQPDAYELAFGTNPLDGGSRFLPVITRITGLELSFPGASGISYTVEYSIGLSAWQEWSTHVGNGEPVAVPLPTAEPSMFFRVRAGN